MAKQFASYFVSWRHSKTRSIGPFPNEADYFTAASEALEVKLNQLADEGWIIDRIMPTNGPSPKETAGFTIVAFK